MTPFEQFWAAWPKSFRKASKSVCQKKWINYKLDLEAEQIIDHVKFMAEQEAWQKDGGKYVPAPLVYLNQRRWDGAEITRPAPKPTTLEILKESRATGKPPSEEIRKKLQELRKQFQTA